MPSRVPATVVDAREVCLPALEFLAKLPTEPDGEDRHQDEHRSKPNLKPATADIRLFTHNRHFNAADTAGPRMLRHPTVTVPATVPHRLRLNPLPAPRLNAGTRIANPGRDGLESWFSPQSTGVHPRSPFRTGPGPGVERAMPARTGRQPVARGVALVSTHDPPWRSVSLATSIRGPVARPRGGPAKRYRIASLRLCSNRCKKA